MSKNEMLKFYEHFSDFEKFSTLSRKLSWSHFVKLLQIDDKIKREFYITICANELWGVRTLRERIGSALYERTIISKKPEETIKNDFAFLARQKRITMDGEEPPIAIILCADKSDMIAQLLELDKSGIHVAQYLTEYIPKEMLEQKLRNSIQNAKKQLEHRKNMND